MVTLHGLSYPHISAQPQVMSGGKRCIDLVLVVVVVGESGMQLAAR
jgi:hypothetical protein